MLARSKNSLIGKSRIKYSGYGEEFAIQRSKWETREPCRKSTKITQTWGSRMLHRPSHPFHEEMGPLHDLLLLYTALVTPYEVGLASPETWEERWADGLWVFNQIVNISFLIGKFEPQEQLLILIRNQLTLYLTFHRFTLTHQTPRWPVNIDLVFNFFLAYTDPETGISVNSQRR